MFMKPQFESCAFGPCHQSHAHSIRPGSTMSGVFLCKHGYNKDQGKCFFHELHMSFLREFYSASRHFEQFTNDQ